MGPQGTRGHDIPIVSRIVYASGMFEAMHQIRGRDGARELALERRGNAFDPAIADAFLAVCREDKFWEGLEQDSVWPTLLAMEPESRYRYIPQSRLEDVALSFADFTDIKSRYTPGHSRRVAETAEGIARGMRLSDEEVNTIKTASLVHDFGQVAIPSNVLEKPQGQLTAAEWEQLRLHPYHAERIFSRVSAWKDLADIVGAHHERIDGQGYHRGTKGSQIPVGARIIAVADRYDELTSHRPDGPAMHDRQAIDVLRSEIGTVFWEEAFRALEVLVTGSGSLEPQKATRRHWPQGLTNREVEILRLAAHGSTRKQIGDNLFISESTVRSHLEHIYNKIGVSTRVAATVFAMENGLLR